MFTQNFINNNIWENQEKNFITAFTRQQTESYHLLEDEIEEEDEDD